MPSDHSVLPASVLAAAVRADATRPRLTFYDDASGATRGERIELSAKVLTNWVSKAGNALQEELDVAPGSRVLLDLPQHWRAVYWALAVWSVGATLVLPLTDTPPGGAAGRETHAPTGLPDPGLPDPDLPDPDLPDPDLVISDDVALVTSVAGGSPARAVLVSLPMLSRGHPDAPHGVFDEARELATYGDVFDAWEAPSASDAALVLTEGGRTEGGGGRSGGGGATATGSTAYGELVVPRPTWGDRPRVELAGSLGRVLLDALSAWYADGSVVLVRDPDGEQAARRTSEGVTVRLR